MRSAALSLLLAALPACAAGMVPGDGASPLDWSRSMADSEISRLGGSLEAGGGAKATWNYTSGFFAYSLGQLGIASGAARYGDLGGRIVGSFIGADGSIRGYRQAEFNLDQVLPGREVLSLYEQTRDSRFRTAAALLRRQLASQPRTPGGGFWHKLIYPDQVWLDGLYMAGPFYSHYGTLFGEPACAQDAADQLLLADTHLYDPATGLYYHAWDARHAQPWADAATGRSPSFWGRAIGWYAMAAVDELDDIPAGSPTANAVDNILRKVADGLVRWQDPQSGVWWQVVDKGGQPGNYLESSASSMFVYALAKGVRTGRLQGGQYKNAALRGFGGLRRQFITPDAGTGLSLTHCCSVAGLNNKNAAGRARDGTFGYYVSEPVVDNDLKAVSAFILSGIELQRMLGPGRSTP